MSTPGQKQVDTLIGILSTINIGLVPAILIQEMVDMDPTRRQSIRVILSMAKQVIDFIDERTADNMSDTYYGAMIVCESCGEIKVKGEECECEYLNR